MTWFSFWRTDQWASSRSNALQAVSLPYVTTLTYASINDQWTHLACPLVSSSKTKQCLQFTYVALYATRFNC